MLRTAFSWFHLANFLYKTVVSKFLPMPYLTTSETLIASYVVIRKSYKKWTPFQLRSWKRQFLSLNKLLDQDLVSWPQCPPWKSNCPRVERTPHVGIGNHWSRMSYLKDFATLRASTTGYNAPLKMYVIVFFGWIAYNATNLFNDNWRQAEARIRPLV